MSDRSGDEHPEESNTVDATPASSSPLSLRKDWESLSLAYHEAYPAGKIGTVLTKALNTQDDLSLAYSPGVAGPCRVIEKDPMASYRYTNRGNLVAVITNGTAVLGLGDIGATAAKPVMEGKSMLFKKFGRLDSFDLEINESDPERFVEIVAALEPSFGGINLEDIKAPDCFYIEEALKERCKIPIFHDDQHGTAIIATAALINALELTHRKAEDIQVVFSGAGAAAIACADMLLTIGVPRHNIVICDTKGVIHSHRKDLNPYKARFARETHLRTMEEAIRGADVFIGVSQAGLLSDAMLHSMAAEPIVFALANPDPEITPDQARRVRSDVIIATGRSDYPNQVNNVLGFPYIFRGALDVAAIHINEDMKRAAAYAIAGLARAPVLPEVQAVYAREGSLSFGVNYLIPKPIDPRALPIVASAVAEAAMLSGAARREIDIAAYRESLRHDRSPEGLH